jgi:hypothetical protein
MSELMYWCSYRVCDMREQKDARPRVNALIAPTSDSNRVIFGVVTPDCELMRSSCPSRCT